MEINWSGDEDQNEMWSGPWRWSPLQVPLSTELAHKLWLAANCSEPLNWKQSEDIEKATQRWMKQKALEHYNQEQEVVHDEHLPLLSDQESNRVHRWFLKPPSDRGPQPSTTRNYECVVVHRTCVSFDESLSAWFDGRERKTADAARMAASACKTEGVRERLEKVADELEVREARRRYERYGAVRAADARRLEARYGGEWAGVEVRECEERSDEQRTSFLRNINVQCQYFRMYGVLLTPQSCLAPRFARRCRLLVAGRGDIGPL